MNKFQTNFITGYWFNFFISAFIYIAPILLLSVYDFAFVTYDSEPDYVASAFHIVEYGVPFKSNHPGTITQYLVSIPLLAALYFELTFESTIFLMRVTELGVLALLLVASINIMRVNDKNTKIFFYSLIWFFIFIYPSTSVLFRYLSSEILLFGLSFLLCALWYKYLRTDRGIASIGVIIGAGINVKLTFIFLLIVFFSFHILYYAYYLKLIKGIRSILNIFTWGCIWFIVFSMPKIFKILPNMANLIDDWHILINKIASLFSMWNFFVIFIIALLVVFLFYWLIKQEVLSKDKSNLINVMIREGWIIALPVAIFVFYKLFYYFIHPEIDYLIGLGQWESLGIMRRNSVPLYAFLVFFIIRFVITKISELKYYQSLLSSSLFLLLLGGVVINVTASKEYMFKNDRIRLFDESLLAIKSKVKNASIFVHHDNYFDSVAQFQLWTTIRYGNCNDKKLDEALRQTYAQIDTSNLSYISAFNGVTKCDINNKNNGISIYNRWLNIPDNVVKLNICDELIKSSNKKIFLLDSRYIDWSSPNEIVGDINSAIQSCNYKIFRNHSYFDNNEIFAFDFIKI